MANLNKELLFEIADEAGFDIETPSKYELWEKFIAYGIDYECVNVTRPLEKFAKILIERIKSGQILL